MTAETIAKALGGAKAGSSWMALCLAHDDREPSLSIRQADDGKVLVHCHAGCDQFAVIEALRARGLWNDGNHHRSHIVRRERRPALHAPPNRAETKRTVTALRLWEASAPARGTLAETYLLSRGLRFPLPATIRFHAGLKHPTGGIWPAMVALVTRGTDDAPLAIHRTFLARDGSGKAPVVPQKMMLGPCHGGAVRLGVLGDILMLGEGIETCLAVMQATEHPAWAALSTSGLRALDLPEAAQEAIVLADGDDSGEAAARKVALRWKREGRSVRIARPPRGADFNDLLPGRAPLVEEGAA